MGQIIEWSNVLGRYPELDKLPGISGGIQEDLVVMAEGAVHSRLAAHYATPFGKDNLTARDLVIDMVFIQTQTTRQPEKAEALREFFNERIAALLDGSSVMSTTSGAAVAAVGGTVWSSTQDFHPTFGMSDIVAAVVDSSMLIDENYARGAMQDDAT